MEFRPATVDDVPAITRIYNQGIVDRIATLETQIRTERERAEWLASRDDRHPVFVAVQDGTVVGWASLNVFNPREAYRHVADFSVYVERSWRGQGVGEFLLGHLIDEARRIAVAYDSSNGVLAAFDVAADGSTSPRWRRDQDHACHPLLFADSGALVTNDHDAARMADQLVVLDIATGDELARVDSGSPVQSVLFMAPGWDHDLYTCSFAGVSRISTGTAR